MASLHVLIIDNSLLHRKIMMRSMQDALARLADGGRVDIATNETETVDKLASFAPHAILFNFAMSIKRIDGDRFLVWLKKHTTAPIVAYGLSEVLRPSALTAGAEAFFLRPTTEDDWPPFASKVVRFLYRIVFEKGENEPAAPLHAESDATHATVSGAPGLPRRPLPRFSPGRLAIRKGTDSEAHDIVEEQRAAHKKNDLTYAELHFAALARQAATGQRKATKADAPLHVTLPDIQPKEPLDLIAIGASTGGTDAIAEVLHHLTPPLPPIVIVQHIPSYFSRLFAIRLNEECTIDIEEASDGDPAYPNHAYIAPGGQHMTVVREGARFMLHCAPGPKVHSVCPSVDVLFDSVADVAGASALGVILTGMGGDGADGLLHMRQKGAETLGQDEKTCVVYGMPRVAYEKGAVAHQLPLQHIAPAILKVAGR